jgi:dTDP-4-amino-4,6-dideoxygalactose transaminase
LRKAIYAKTKAILPVHLFGQPANMDPLLEVAAEHGLPVIEDACQAHGALYNGRKAGSIGDIGCFSFYPGKNLGAFGEAGAIVTNNSDLHERMKILRDHGQVRKYHHAMVGWNCRMDGIQAAVLQIKLRHLSKANGLRRQHAAFYNSSLGKIDAIITPFEAPYARHVFHIYSIRVRDRDEVLRAMEACGISCGIHYPVPVHLQEAYTNLGYKLGAFPVAEKCSNQFISLPIFPELTVEQLEAVVEAVKCALASDLLA